VDTAAEGEVPVVGPAEIQPVGLGVHLRIAGGGGAHGQDLLSGLDDVIVVQRHSTARRDHRRAAPCHLRLRVRTPGPADVRRDGSRSFPTAPG